jgi:A/G-specific adenine glycosylase
MTDFAATIIKWYAVHKRSLPWRDIKDAYKIWISEIILQQTRVNQGLDYYLKFVERFPDVKSLAEASEDEALKYWQGLGYYSRARNLHKAAKIIAEQHNCVFPRTYDAAIALPGIGAYTAAAICSFAFDAPRAVVDGNVYRVLSRFFADPCPIDTGEGAKHFATLANRLLVVNQSAVYNQALMDFGALQCLPSQPDCGVCPLAESCMALNINRVNDFPVKTKKISKKERFFNYLFIVNRDDTFLQKRTANDIWKNLYEFPLIELHKLLSTEELINHSAFSAVLGKQFAHIRISGQYRHILTHQVINARFFSVQIENAENMMAQFVKIPVAHLEKYAVSRLMEMFLEK